MEGSPAPEGITPAENPAYPVGTQVTLTTDHMPGMKGAKGTIAASTTQTVYMVDYQADGMTMTNHKWVVQDEMAPRR